MARTQKDTVDYFPHYADASGRDTLTVLEGQFGNDGYVFWFKLLERLASTDGHFIACANSKKWQLLLARSRVNEDVGVEIMKLLVEMGAIDKQLWVQDKIIWCQNLVDNVADVYRNRRRSTPQKPISTRLKLLTTPEKAKTTPDNPQSKLKESKVEEIKEEEIISSSSLSKKDVLEAYEQNIGYLTEDMENELEFAINRFTAAWVIDAIREAVLHNKRNWAYTAGILKNWEHFGKDAAMSGKSDPNKYIKGKYGHLVQR